VRTMANAWQLGMCSTSPVATRVPALRRAEVLGAGAAVGGVGEDHFGGFVVRCVEGAADVGAFAYPRGQGAIVGR
jgi:hypothetical protein